MRCLLIAMLAAAGAWPSEAVDPQRLAVARAKTGKAEKSLARHDTARAEALFRAAIAAEPAYPEAHLGLGTLLVAQQRFAEAIAVLEEAKQRYVRWAQGERETEMAARQEAAARAREFADLQLQQASRGRPGPTGTATSPLTALAANRVATEEYLARRGWRMENLQAVPASLFYLQGLAFLRTGQRHRGIEELRTCLAVDAGHGLAHYNLAVALFSGGEIALAKEHLDAARAAAVTPHPAFAADLDQAALSLRPTDPP
jgi:predicted metal-dependent hydrolase